MNHPNDMKAPLGKRSVEGLALQCYLRYSAKTLCNNIPASVWDIALDAHPGKKTLELLEAIKKEYYPYVRISGSNAEFSVPLPGKSWVKHEGMVQYQGKGYTTFQLRNDVSRDFRALVDELDKLSVKLTSSGSRRSLSTVANKNQSSTSYHYLGIALDLYVYSGMVDPRKDPFVVQWDAPNGQWRVYARVPEKLRADLPSMGVVHHLVDHGFTFDRDKSQLADPKYTKRVSIQPERMVDLTALMSKHGFFPIRPKASFFSMTKNNGGAEWWHFQHERYVHDLDKFGDQLYQLYSPRVFYHMLPVLDRRMIKTSKRLVSTTPYV